MNLSKNHIKLITSLQQKKYRQKHNLFVAEGLKVVEELLNSSFVLELIFATDDCALELPSDKKIGITALELKKISQLKTPNKVLALFQIPLEKEIVTDGLIVALDAINDPGNLGTIIRLCDWFGVSQLICSLDTVHCYNQKVVQASMGSLTRVSVVYTDLKSFIEEANMPVFVADMDGTNMYTSAFPKKGILVMGNEANGISKEVMGMAQHKVSIPQFGEEQKTESLNVATATAILLSEFKRN